MRIAFLTGISIFQVCLIFLNVKDPEKFDKAIEITSINVLFTLFLLHNKITFFYMGYVFFVILAFEVLFRKP